MENLNAEAVKKDLKELMYEAYASNGAHKPYLTMRDALALINSQAQRIKELTEENERLRAENVDCQLGFRLLEDAFKRLEKINEQTETEVKADTVRKMREWLQERVKGIYLNEGELFEILDEYEKQISEDS